jgi:sec-independent protein translocase protein TatC
MRHIHRDDAEMPFLDHLEELRWRIIWSAIAVVLGIGIGFFVVIHYGVLDRLEASIKPYLDGRSVMATRLTDGLQFTVRAAMWIGIVLSFPVVLYHAWSFLSPALNARERRILIAALIGGIALFVAGALVSYVVILPITLPWLFGLLNTAFDPMITADSYFDLVFTMGLSFGLAFELPVLVLMLSAAGLVTPQTLSRYRRHAFVTILVAGAFLTPGGDVLITLALSGALYLLFELSVGVARVMSRRRANDDTVAVLLAPLLLLRGLAWSTRREPQPEKA